MRLPPNYYYGGVGGNSPAFQGTTVDTVKQKMANNNRVQAINGVVCFHCPYCQVDPTLQGLHVHRQWHPEHLCQIDHIVPFAVVVGNVGAYYTLADYQVLANHGYVPQPGFGGAGGGWNVNDLLQRTILYNDIDNLHVTCTGHNQQKSNQVVYLGQTAAQIRLLYPNP